MAQRGGYRAGSGRKPKLAPPSPAEQTPVQYLLSVMRDPTASAARRDKAAIAAAKYVEQPVPRVLPLGKKARAEIEARDAAKGTDWEGLLDWPAMPPKAASPNPTVDADAHQQKWHDILGDESMN